MRRAWSAVAVGLACAVAVAQDAACDVDVDLPLAAQVRGSILPADGCASFALDMPRFSTLAATAKAVGFGPVPTIEVTSEDGGPTGVVRLSGRGASLKTMVPTGGRRRILVAGDGEWTGDFVLTFAVKPRTRWASDGTSIGAEATASFAAPAGATARVKLVPTRGSAFVPRLIAIDGPDGFTAALGGGGTAGPVTLGGTGEYVLRFDGEGGASGDWTARIDLAPARVPTARFDFTGRALTGDARKRGAAYGRVVGPAGATLAPPTRGTELDGVSFVVPADALQTPTLATLTSGRAFRLIDGAHAAGPFVRLVGAEGSLVRPAVITLPYDAAEFADPAAELTVQIRGDIGDQASTLRAGIDVSTPGVAKVTTFSDGTYVVVSPRPRRVAGAWKLLRFSYDVQDGYAASATSTMSDAVASGGSLVVTGISGRRATWTPTGQDTATAVDESVHTTTSGALNVVDDATVTFADSVSGKTLTFVRGGGSDALMAAGRGKSPVTGADVPQLDLLLRAAGPATASTMVGRWHLFFFGLGAGASDGFHVRLSSHQLVGSLEVYSPAANGLANVNWTASRAASSSFPLAPGGWREEKTPQLPTRTFSVEDGVVRLYLVVGAGQPVELHPVMGGDVLVGAVGGTFGEGSEAGFLLLARQTTGHIPLELVGVNPTVRIVESLRERVTKPQGLGVGIGLGTATRTARSLDLPATLNVFSVDHDLNTGAALDLVGSLPAHAAGFRLTGTGRYAGGDGVAGFVTPRGDLLVGARTGDHFLETLIELPASPR